ncbi:MAG: energy transducer TonB, partial [Thermodesulfobacteriota bacterium]
MPETNPASTEHQRPKKNGRVMQVTLIVSLAVHVLLFMHMSGVFESDSVSSIELTMRDVSKPFTRNIPRPRNRHNTPKVHDAEKVSVPDRQVPKPDIDTDMAESPSLVTEAVSVPDTEGIRPAEASEIGFEHQATPVFAKKADYFEMVRMRIETRKTYPESARKDQKQGGVSVRFTITREGNVKSVAIAESSGHDILDSAALSAVKDAAPLPRPPRNLFDDQLKVKITIMF